MIIVTGNYQVPPDQRDRFMSSKREQAERTRHEAGCLEYAFSADAEQPGLVRLIELWESMADLKAHLQGLRPTRRKGSRSSRMSKSSARPSPCSRARPAAVPSA